MASREKKRKSHISAWGLFLFDGVVKNKRSPTMSWKDWWLNKCFVKDPNYDNFHMQNAKLANQTTNIKADLTS